MVQPNLTDGTTTVNLQAFEPAESSKLARLAKQGIPERNGDIIQFMGTSSETIVLNCYLTVAADLTQLKTWRNAGTSLTYNDDDHTNLMVVIEDVSVRQPVSVQANYREFAIVLVES